MMQVRGGLRGGVRALALLLLAGVAVVARAGTDDPRAWIERMNDALIKRDYDGVFIRQVGGHRETMRIIHRVRDGRMVERLVSTDGSGREFVRDGSEWTTYFPDRGLVVVEQRKRTGGFMSPFTHVGADADRYYELRSAGQQRVQGVSTRLFLVIPRDSLRYGYRFWIDEKTNMPVRTQLVTAGGETIVDISFVSLNLAAKISDELLKPDVDTTGFRWLRRDQPDAEHPVTVAFAPREQLLPSGFAVKFANGPVGTSGGPQSRYILSDGIAWVSVFVESAAAMPPGAGKSNAVINGAGQMGSSAFFTLLANGHRVTAMGEVPPATVKAIAEALQPE